MSYVFLWIIAFLGGNFIFGFVQAVLVPESGPGLNVLLSLFFATLVVVLVMLRREDRRIPK